MDKVQVSETGKAKLKEKYGKQQAGYTIETLAKAANTTEDKIKYLIGQNTQKVTAVDRFVIQNVVKAINAGLEKNGKDEKLTESDIVDNWDTPNIPAIPTEFKTLIDDKTQIFCGRKFVFNAITKFIKDQPRGYFTILGDPGMGKSAIAAKYIVDNSGTICFFNIRTDRTNRPDKFLELIRQQLVNRFNLQNTENDNLSTLLTKASEKLADSRKLIIVIDALDEVDQDDHANLLNLPMYLPDNVYIILTRRQYNLDDKRLTLSPNTKYKELDLREYQENSKDDVESYILEFLALDKYKAGLEKWINQQNDLSKPKFVDTIAAKSENNFMYLRYVLEAIADGFYKDEKLEELPKDLEEHYYNHWRIMGMKEKPFPKDKIKIIYVICFAKTAISDDLIAKYSKQSNLKVQQVLQDLNQFLQIQKQENNQPNLYRFYHESFRDFLQKQDIMKAVEESLPEIKTEISNNISEGLYD